MLAGIDDPGYGERRAIRSQMGELGGYAPGKNAIPYPKDTGILLRKEAKFRFQMHYTPNGKATTDVTRLGLYFYDKPPKHSMQMELIYNASLAIPANTKSHSESLDKVFDRDIMLYSLLPHAHLRGRAAKFTAHYPDGREEILLSVPKYDFNWQPLYVLNPSKLMPAGTRVVMDMTWDNSAQNPANPDPSMVVRWGDQTWEEMNVGWFRFRNADDEDRANAARSDADARAADLRQDHRRQTEPFAHVLQSKTRRRPRAPFLPADGPSPCVGQQPVVTGAATMAPHQPRQEPYSRRSNSPGSTADDLDGQERTGSSPATRLAEAFGGELGRSRIEHRGQSRGGNDASACACGEGLGIAVDEGHQPTFRTDVRRIRCETTTCGAESMCRQYYCAPERRHARVPQKHPPRHEPRSAWRYAHRVAC